MIDLVSYCLMPNHFHLLVRQHDNNGISELMRCLNTKYVMYFNKRHSRVGGLYQDAYKACFVDSDSYLMHLSRYIHLNPKGLRRSHKVFPYSSYKYYIDKKKPPIWLKPESVMELFKNKTQYAEFVDNQATNSKSFLGDIAID